MSLNVPAAKHLSERLNKARDLPLNQFQTGIPQEETTSIKIKQLCLPYSGSRYPNLVGVMGFHQFWSFIAATKRVARAKRVMSPIVL